MRCCSGHCWVAFLVLSVLHCVNVPTRQAFLLPLHAFLLKSQKNRKMQCLFLSTPSVFPSPWQRSSFLIMRKLNLLVPKQRGNKSHAHLGPWVFSHTACFPGMSRADQRWTDPSSGSLCGAGQATQSQSRQPVGLCAL